MAKKNKELEHYHPGIYGSKSISKWSCCHARNRSEPGCMSVIQGHQYKRGTSVRSQVSIASSNSSTGDTESLKSSSSCLSSLYVSSTKITQNSIYNHIYSFYTEMVNSVWIFRIIMNVHVHMHHRIYICLTKMAADHEQVQQGQMKAAWSKIHSPMSRHT